MRSLLYPPPMTLMPLPAKTKRMKAVRVRLSPNQAQQRLLNHTFGCARFIYNRLLGMFWDQLDADPSSWVDYHQLSRWVTVLKSSGDFPWLLEVDKFALQNAARDLATALSNWRSSKSGRRKGKSVGKPKFKSKKIHLPKYRTQFQGAGIKDGKLQLPKLGLIPFRTSDEMQGVLAGARLISGTITRLASGEYMASLNYEVEEEVMEPCLPTPEEWAQLPMQEQEGLICDLRIMSGDLGLKHFLTLLDGDGGFESVQNPKFYRKSLKRLRRLQKKLSRQVGGRAEDFVGEGKGRRRMVEPSLGYERTRMELAKVHAHLRNQREDFIHQLSHRMLRDHDVIVLEDLNILGMVKNRRLSRSIMDAGWGGLVRALTYKAEWRGKFVVKVDRFFPSSQLCSCCREKNGAVKDLKVRSWSCTACGAAHDRDENAALNLKGEGLRMLLDGMFHGKWEEELEHQERLAEGRRKRDFRRKKGEQDVASGEGETKNACGGDVRLAQPAIPVEA